MIPRTVPSKMTEEELLSYVKDVLKRSSDLRSEGLADVRDDVWRAFQGRPSGRKRDGEARVGSQYHTREVNEISDQIKQKMDDILLGNGRQIGVFQARRREDEDAARNVTDAINFMLDTPNNRIELLNWLRALTLFPNAYMGIYPTKDGMAFELENISPEDILIDPDLQTPNLDQALIVVRRVWYPATEEQLERFDISPNTDILDAISDWERWSRDQFDLGGADIDDDKIGVGDVWLRDDMEAPWMHFEMYGDKLIPRKGEDIMPYVSATTDPQPYIHWGNSPGMKAYHIQLMRTQLYRNLLDAVEKAAQQKIIISEEALSNDLDSIEMITDPDSRIIPVAGNVGDAIGAAPTPTALSDMISAIQLTAPDISVRTGVSPEADTSPEVLQSGQTGTVAMANRARDRHVAAYARNVANTGFLPLLTKAFEYVVKGYLALPTSIPKKNGGWTDIGQMELREGQFSVNVGLGFATQETIAQGLGSYLSLVDKLSAMGLAGVQELFRATLALLEAQGIENASSFLIDPSSEEFMAWSKNQQKMAEEEKQRQHEALMRPLESSEKIEHEKLNQKETELRLKQQEDTAEATVGFENIRLEKEKLDQGWAKLALEKEKIELEKAEILKQLPMDEVQIAKTEAEIDFENERVEKERRLAAYEYQDPFGEKKDDGKKQFSRNGI